MLFAAGGLLLARSTYPDGLNRASVWGYRVRVRVRVRVTLESNRNGNRNRNRNPHSNPNPNPKPNPKPHQVWGEAVTEEMVLDEQMLRGL